MMRCELATCVRISLLVAESGVFLQEGLPRKAGASQIAGTVENPFIGKVKVVIIRLWRFCSLHKKTYLCTRKLVQVRFLSHHR